LLLTGTPALAKPRELFSLLSIIRPDVFNYFKLFGDRFCDPQPSKYFNGLVYDGSSNSKELHFILKKGLMIRRLKKDVLQDLPSKRR
jgi:SWI/SNF-related matrix-associated actin-dependent regulator of chromatin subfamily A-like protein 1